MTICIAENLSIQKNTAGKNADQSKPNGFSELLFDLFDQQSTGVPQEDDAKDVNQEVDMADMYVSAYIAAGKCAQIITDTPQSPMQEKSNDIPQITNSPRIDGLPPPAEALTNGHIDQKLQNEASNPIQTKDILNDGISFSKLSEPVHVNDTENQAENQAERQVNFKLEVQNKPPGKQDLMQDTANYKFQDALANLETYVNKYPENETTQKVKQLTENIPQQAKNTIMFLAQKQPQIINEMQSAELKVYNKDNQKSGKADFVPSDIKTDANGSDIQKTEDFLKLHISVQEMVKQKPASDANESKYKPFANYVSEKADEKTNEYDAAFLYDHSLSKPVHRPLSFNYTADNVKKVPFENIIDGITQSLTEAVKEGKKELTIVLTPENLGQLSLKVSSDENGVTAHIITDNLHVRDELSRQSVDLRDNISGQGFKVNTIEIQYKGKSDGADLFSGFSQQSGQQHSGQNAKQQQPEQRFNRYMQNTDPKAAINVMLKNITEKSGLDYLV